MASSTVGAVVQAWAASFRSARTEGRFCCAATAWDRALDHHPRDHRASQPADIVAFQKPAIVAPRTPAVPDPGAPAFGLTNDHDEQQSREVCFVASIHRCSPLAILSTYRISRDKLTTAHLGSYDAVCFALGNVTTTRFA